MPPLPKKRSERRRRNIVPGEVVTSVLGTLKVPQPPLHDSEVWSQNAINWYESLAESGQALHYEPSDWQLAKLVASWITDYDMSVKPSASLLGYIMDGMTKLLVSEGDRRRAHMEIERPDEPPEEALPEDIAAIQEYRTKLRGK